MAAKTSTKSTTKRTTKRPPANAAATSETLSVETASVETASVDTPKLAHDDIARRAFELFLARGRQHGRAQEDWLSAERELRERYSVS